MRTNNGEAAFVPVVGGVGLVEEGLRGYTPFIAGSFSWDESEQRAKELNQKAGVDPDVAEELHAGSMFGWHVPAAGRFRYSDKKRKGGLGLAVSLN